MKPPNTLRKIPFNLCQECSYSLRVSGRSCNEAFCIKRHRNKSDEAFTAYTRFYEVLNETTN